MIQTVFGKHAAIAAIVVIALTGAASALGWIDQPTATTILMYTGAHAAAASSPWVRSK